MKKQFMTAMLAAATLSFTATASMAAIEGCPDSIVVGTEGAYPPFNYIDEGGNLKGFDVDIANALCDEIGAECTFQTQDWAGIIPGLLANKYDAIIASMSITAEREEKVDFTKKYYQSPARFAGPKGMDVEISEDGLDGMIVGTQRATVSENFLRDNFGDVIDIKTYDTQEEASLDLISGRLDLVFADAIKLQEGFLASDDGESYEFKGPSFSDPEWFGEGIGIAVRPGEDTLRQCFNEAIDNILADGTYERISNEHFGMNIYGE
ncbi:transporter substrate-binding domain-containing protein [Ferruginivarius sediminum]|uniref:ABC transporter substrate-binding protein n=1 Tax=Ferruginivarius sediminum TaxID=2661937 RepID=A0A369TFE4_9PROT|nr:transporter substrate-binding domain-containing protein [Ferruginivarius sediminum]RDD63314.1 ABC transporter substrate-binding protein [Ferruginivarius sediminum]